MSVVGSTYLERGEPVVVLTQWAVAPKACRRWHVCPTCGRFGELEQPPGDGCVFAALARSSHPVDAALRRLGSGPRNVLIRRCDGSEVVRPFRGLRRPT